MPTPLRRTRPVLGTGAARTCAAPGPLLPGVLSASLVVAASLLLAPGGGVAQDVPEPDLVADGLEVPWAMAFAPDGRIFVTERPGRVRVIGSDGSLDPEPWAVVDVAEEGDGGLQGIALAPGFPENPHVYVMGTVRGADGAIATRILRYTEREGRGEDPVVVFGPIPSPGVHRGGALAFGPDDRLYASLGESRVLEAPQDSTDPRGAILRLEADGSIPVDNPFPGSPVWSVGHRNPQGLAFDPVTGAAFATEHGPSDFPGEGGRTGQDEVNAPRKGSNHGWPAVSGMHDDPAFVRPLVEWTPAVAPGGLGVARPAGAPGPVLWVGGLRGQRLVRLVLEPATDAEGAGWRVVSTDDLYAGRFGRIRAVAVAPDGSVYFGTSNRDANGADGAPADRILRIGG